MAGPSGVHAEAGEHLKDIPTKAGNMKYPAQMLTATMCGGNQLKVHI